MTAQRAVCRIEELPVGEGRAFAVDGEQVAVFRLRSGTLHATQATCPHLGGPLADGQVDAAVLVCPLHGWVWDLDSGGVAGRGDDAGLPRLRTYPVRLDGDDVVVTLA